MSRDTTPSNPLSTTAPSPAHPSKATVRAGFWVVLAREISDLELREQLRGFDAGMTEHVFFVMLLSSPEFRIIHTDWRAGRKPDRDEQVVEAGLSGLGTNEHFVDLVYRLLFGRPSDDEGLRHYTGELARGGRRLALVRTLALSDEFDRRYRDMSPDGGIVPRDVQLCELANPAKWDNPEWIEVLRSLQVLPDHKLSMHRKTYEITQMVWGLRRLGHLREDASIVSVGAGHESVLYWLANHVRRVVATDMYGGVWQSQCAREGEEDVLKRPEAYAPFSYRADRLAFLKMDGRRLGFGDATFDVAYSLSSIEHFGGLEGAAQAVDEMARVVKPGGMIVVATEYLIDGPQAEDAFPAADIHRLASRPGLELVEPIDEQVWKRYEGAPVDLRRNRHQTPHMVVKIDDTIFTSVMLFLRRAGG